MFYQRVWIDLCRNCPTAIVSSGLVPCLFDHCNSYITFMEQLTQYAYLPTNRIPIYVILHERQGTPFCVEINLCTRRTIYWEPNVYIFYGGKYRRRAFLDEILWLPAAWPNCHWVFIYHILLLFIWFICNLSFACGRPMTAPTDVGCGFPWRAFLMDSWNCCIWVVWII